MDQGTPSVEIPIARLTLDPAEHLPVDLGHLLALVGGAIVDHRPIEIEYIDGGLIYRIINGRHRYLAAILRGEIIIRAVIVKPSPWNHTPGVPHYFQPPGRVMDHRPPDPLREGIL